MQTASFTATAPDHIIDTRLNHRFVVQRITFGILPVFCIVDF
jgi:hypothetical protein